VNSAAIEGICGAKDTGIHTPDEESYSTDVGHDERFEFDTRRLASEGVPAQDKSLELNALEEIIRAKAPSMLRSMLSTALRRESAAVRHLPC
jgi:hypothetical protein